MGTKIKRKFPQLVFIKTTLKMILFNQLYIDAFATIFSLFVASRLHSLLFYALNSVENIFDLPIFPLARALKMSSNIFLILFYFDFCWTYY